MKQRIVIKVGTHVLTEQNRLAKTRIKNLVLLIASLQGKYEIILVSSGAVAAGYQRVKLDKKELPNRQALASIGQPHLMSTYQKKFSYFDIEVAQVLLIAEDFRSKTRTTHAKNAIDTLLSNGVVPIINENDVTVTKELVFGDNDQLSAFATHYFDANLLVMLSDIDGYYDDNPKTNTNAKLLKTVNTISKTALNDTSSSNHEFATGGIVTKLKAAKFLLDNGKKAFLASGFDLSDVKSFLIDEEHKGGTLFQ